VQTQRLIVNAKMVKFSLCLTNEALLHENIRGSGYIYIYIHIFLISALAGGEWSASRLGRFTPGKSPHYPLDRRLGEPQSRSGRRGEEKILVNF
jgi:hypothetical protein